MTFIIIDLLPFLWNGDSYIWTNITIDLARVNKMYHSSPRTQ